MMGVRAAWAEDAAGVEEPRASRFGGMLIAQCGSRTGYGTWWELGMRMKQAPHHEGPWASGKESGHYSEGPGDPRKDFEQAEGAKGLVWVRGIERLIFVEYLSAGPLFSCLILGMTFHIGDYQCIL